MRSPLNNTLPARGLIDPNHTSTLQLAYTAPLAPWPWVFISQLLSVSVSFISFRSSFRGIRTDNNNDIEPDLNYLNLSQKTWARIGKASWYYTTLRVFWTLVVIARVDTTTAIGPGNYGSKFSLVSLMGSCAVSLYNYSLLRFMNTWSPVNYLFTLVALFICAKPDLYGVLALTGARCPSLYSGPSDPDTIIAFTQNPSPILNPVNCTESDRTIYHYTILPEEWSVAATALVCGISTLIGCFIVGFYRGRPNFPGWHFLMPRHALLEIPEDNRTATEKKIYWILQQWDFSSCPYRA